MSSYQPVPDFFANRSVFVTGGTGFLGKALIEKLLRSCPKVNKVFVLVRPKRGKSVEERLEELLTSQLFDEVKKTNSDFHTKLAAISGDILDPALGIRESDLQTLIDEVSVVVHSAATVRFDDPLKVSVRMNIEGTKKVIELAQQLKHLDAFVHVSTAYANCDREHIEELIYPPALHPQKLIDAVEWMDEDMLDQLTPSLLGEKPNTYTFTKQLAEYLLVEMAQNLPAVIVRPSIVGASWNEPVKGWVDNFNGPAGLMTAISKGLLRSMVGDKDLTADIVPVDVVVNLILVAAWNTALNSIKPCEIESGSSTTSSAPQRIPVYNCTTGQLSRRDGKHHRFTWGEMEQLAQQYFIRNPVSDCIRVPHAKFTTNEYLHNLRWIFDHQLPAALMDFWMYMSGRRAVFVRVNQKLNRSIRSLDYFTSHEWIFSNDNLLSLITKLSTADKKEFNMDCRKLNWPPYVENYCYGLKRFALNEDLGDEEKARANMRRLHRLSFVFNTVLVVVMWRLLVKRVKVAHNLWYLMLNLAVSLFSKVPTFARS